MVEERPMTVKEVAEFLSLSRYRVWEYIKSGLLKAYKIGDGIGNSPGRKEWRIWRTDLMDFINRHPSREG